MTYKAFFAEIEHSKVKTGNKEGQGRRTQYFKIFPLLNGSFILLKLDGGKRRTYENLFKIYLLAKGLNGNDEGIKNPWETIRRQCALRTS